MSATYDLERRIADHYAAEAPTRAPDWVLERILASADSTPQQRTFVGRPWRIPPMFSSARLALTVAAIAAIALVGLSLQAPAVGPAPSPSLTDSPSQTEAPTAAPVPPTTAAIETPPPQGQWDCIVPALAGSAYSASAGTISVTAKVPAGWHGGSFTFDVWNGPCLSSSSLRLQVALVQAVYADACHWLFSEVAMTTPAEVTAALEAQIGHQPIEPTNTTVGGRPASRFDYPNSTGLPGECDDNHAFLTAGGLSGPHFVAPAPGEAMTFYVVDVDGVAVGVGALQSGPLPQDLAQLDAIIASLQFEP